MQGVASLLDELPSPSSLKTGCIADVQENERLMDLLSKLDRQTSALEADNARMKSSAAGHGVLSHMHSHRADCPPASPEWDSQDPTSGSAAYP